MAKDKFYIGQIIEGEYPDGLVDWVNSREPDAGIIEIEPKEDGTKRYQVIETEQPKNLITEEQFLANFFEIPSYGWYRKKPKGYADAVTSFNTAYNMVQTIGYLPTGSLLFYIKPDFTNKEQCTEGWLLENKFKSKEMTKEEFNDFYSVAIQTWNRNEHEV